jgi:hypothetical protein
MFASSSASSNNSQEQKKTQEVSADSDMRLVAIRELFESVKFKILKSGSGRMTEVEFAGNEAAALKFRELVKGMDKMPNAIFIAYFGVDKGKRAPTIMLADVHMKFLNEKLPDIFTLEDHTTKTAKKTVSTIGAKRWS